MEDVKTRDPVPEALKGLRIVDADTHISEWDNLWTARAPAKYRDRVPRKAMFDGKPMWVIDGGRSLGVGPNSSIRADGSKASGFEYLDWQLEDVHRGAYDVKARVRFMDENGIWAQIAYPNALGFGGQKARHVDEDLRLISTQIFNDAMAELQQDSGNRIFPMALMPWWDVAKAVAEAKRCVAMGLRGVNINSDPQEHGLPDLADRHWDPFWEVCVANDLPVNFHIGASDTTATWSGTGRWPSLGRDLIDPASLAFGSVMLFMGNSRVLTNMLLSLFLERFPTLKIVSVESGVGWIPFVLEAVEYEMRETKIPYKVPPFELFQRQIYACSWFERRSLVPMTRMLGVDNVMFETDFPHPTCLYPDALHHIADAAADFTPAERAKVFGENAARVYNLPIPK